MSWLSGLTSVFIGFSFITIGLGIGYLSWKRYPDLDFPKITVAFANLLFWCGVSRMLMGIDTWTANQSYIIAQVSLCSSLITAAAAIPVAALIPDVIKIAIRTPSAKEYDDANAQLEKYISQLDLKRINVQAASEIMEQRFDALHLTDPDLRRLLNVIRSASAR